MQPKTIAILGAGTRGAIFGEILNAMPHLATVVAVAEPREAYRTAFAERHGLGPERVFQSWQEFAAGPKLCDAVVIATMDRDHMGPALACLEKGYDLLLEKPMAATLAECVAIEQAQRRSGAVMGICHSLRYHKGFHQVKKLIDAGRIGRIVTIDQLEQVGFAHFAHSFIRGNWGNAGRSTPMLLAKSCHDLDYISYLVGAECTRVSSFGSLTHFRPELGPAEAPARCTDGCPLEASCTYSALKQYVQADLHTWPAAVISPVHTREAHLEAIQTGPYGRCVYRADNDVVDHQVVLMEFENDVTATFTMTGFTQGMGRRLRVHGTEGELAFDEATITIKTFADGNVETITLAKEGGHNDHGGGDTRVFRNWLEALHRREPGLILATAQASLRSHAMVFAAEEARHTRQVVELEAFRRAHGMEPADGDWKTSYR
jgi:predicted dehydrogenase